MSNDIACKGLDVLQMFWTFHGLQCLRQMMSCSAAYKSLQRDYSSNSYLSLGEWLQRKNNNKYKNIDNNNNNKHWLKYNDHVFCLVSCSGLFKILGELVEYVDPYGEYDLKDRFNLAIYSKNSPVCRPGKYHCW